MMDKFSNLSRATICIMVALFSNSTLTLAQQEQPNNSEIAEKIYEDYTKLGIIIGKSLLYTTNEPNAVSYYYPTQKAITVGVEYNFLQKKEFNFRTAFIWRNYNLKNTEVLKGEDLGEDYTFRDTFSVGPNNQYLIPIEIEYLIFLLEKATLSLRIGPEFMIYPHDFTSGSRLTVSSTKEKIGYTEKGKSNDNWLYIGGNVSIGFTIKTNILLIKPYLTYHYQPKSIYTNTLTTQNLMVSENTISRHEIKGDYLMFGVAVNFKNRLWKL